MLTFGIAGHVDHGKTSLVRALTGMQTDRLVEEQRRGISIELGFAWLDVPVVGHGMQRVALVDMPGHERFVRRMIAGAAALDAVVLVVAADEGAMPQGREHLAICQLLGVQRGAIVLSKVDMVDADLLELAQLDVGTLAQGTFLEGAPVWSFSALRPDLIAQLRDHIAQFAQQLLDERPKTASTDTRPFAMGIDRAFTIAGRGTVVAGTASVGSLTVEQNLVVLPSGKLFRVRGLQQQGLSRSEISAPGRVAINLAGATLADVAVGNVVAVAQTIAVGRRCVARLRTLAHAPQLAKEARATVHLGTDSCAARIRQLSSLPQEPDQVAWVEVFFDRPMPLPANSRFVVRGSQLAGQSGRTIGGGTVLFGWPRRLPAAKPATLALLDHCVAPQATLQLAATVALAGERGLTELELSQSSALPAATILRTVKELAATATLRRAGSTGRVLDAAAFTALETRLKTVIAQFHQEQPARAGLDAEAIARLLGAWLDPAVAVAVAGALVKRTVLQFDGQSYAIAGFAPKAAVSTDAVARVVAAIDASDLAPPLFAELAATLLLPVKDVQAAAVLATQQGELVRVAEDHFLATHRARTAADRVIAAFGAVEAFSTGELKDLLGLTRKHLIPFAQWLDSDKVTVRDAAGNRKIRARALLAWQQKTALQ